MFTISPAFSGNRQEKSGKTMRKHLVQMRKEILIVRVRYAFYAFLTGLVAYPVIEILYRGWTHWTMSILGGFCFMAAYLIYVGLEHRPLWLRAIVCGLVVTELEFITGMIVNRLLHWNVWDYGARWGNVAGQVCPLFSFFWILLSYGDMLLIRLYRRRRFARAEA